MTRFRQLIVGRLPRFLRAAAFACVLAGSAADAGAEAIPDLPEEFPAAEFPGFQSLRSASLQNADPTDRIHLAAAHEPDFIPRPRPGRSEPAAVDSPDAPEPPASTEPVLAATGDFLPRPRPELDAALATRFLANTFFYGFPPDFVLKGALDAIGEGRHAAARVLIAEHPDPLARAMVDWFIARDPESGLGPRAVVDMLESHMGWPEPERLQLRAEQAFHALGPQGEDVLAFYSLVPPRTIGGRLAFAGALRDAGRIAEARRIVQKLWRETELSSGQAAAVIARFGSELTRADHLHRFRRLALNGRGDEAAVQAELLGEGYAGFGRAVAAVVKREGRGKTLLAAVPAKFSADPAYVFAKAWLTRRSGKPVEAAQLLLKLPAGTANAGDGDVWWEERRDLSRVLLDRGNADLAYRIVAASAAEGDAERTEAAFHAGWYALRFLNEPASAAPHFRKLLQYATLTRTKARAFYWLGRTREAEGKAAEARASYESAAQFGGSFYGQLAREKLGVITTGLERSPAASALDRLRFAHRDSVKAIRMLAAAGHAERALPFIRAVAETADTPGEMALLVNLTRRIGLPHAGTRAAVVAEQRGLRVASLTAPFLGVPAGLSLPDPVDRALVYAVVRQESAFNHQATSHAGARGLMQLMPGTARATARNAQLPFSLQRLTTDPLYNATLGAHHLGELLDRLDRSYVLTFVGYNAGPGRVRDWVGAYGDPRRGATDPVDWIERIPFDETRDYVQKVMENLQVYRSRIGRPLSLSRDLARGGPAG